METAIRTSAIEGLIIRVELKSLFIVVMLQKTRCSQISIEIHSVVFGKIKKVYHLDDSRHLFRHVYACVLLEFFREWVSAGDDPANDRNFTEPPRR